VVAQVVVESSLHCLCGVFSLYLYLLSRETEEGEGDYEVGGRRAQTPSGINEAFMVLCKLARSITLT
jgi:hypothetical protein